MSDLRKLVAAIEAQKPEILAGWTIDDSGDSLTIRIWDTSEDFVIVPLDFSRPLLSGLLMEWAVRCDSNAWVFEDSDRSESWWATRTGVGKLDSEHDFPDLLAALAWVCGVEVDA